MTEKPETDISNLDISRLNTFEYINAGNMILDANGRIIYAEPALKKIFSISHPFPQTIEEFDKEYPIERNHSLSKLVEALNTNEPWHDIVIIKQGTENKLMCDISAQKLKDTNGKDLITLITIRDITRERDLEKQVIQSQQMELLGSLSSGISHEFKNLLTVIMAYASLLQEQLRDTPQYDDASKITDTAQKANSLIARLMAVTRPSKPRLENIEIKNVLSDLVIMLNKALPKDIELNAPEEESMPRVFADSVVLYRALLNLCLNARDAMPNGGILTIEVDLIEVEKQDLEKRWTGQTPGTYMTVSITDNGIGMTKETKERIFEPFFTTKKGGTGLGLSVVDHTIRGMGGWITIYSEPGLGSCVRVYIPTAKEELTAILEEEDAEPSTGTETILAIDDDPLTLSVAQRFLENSGYKVYTATGGEEAISFYLKHHDEIDIVLLDVVMPYMQGAQVRREFLKINPDVLILFVSGFTAKTVDRLLDSASVNFLSKPFTAGRLTAEVRRVLDEGKKGPS